MMIIGKTVSIFCKYLLVLSDYFFPPVANCKVMNARKSRKILSDILFMPDRWFVENLMLPSKVLTTPLRQKYYSII